MTHFHPFCQLPKITHREMRQVNRSIRCLPRIDRESIGLVSKQLLGTPIVVKPGLVEWCDTESLSDKLTEPLVAVILEKDPGGAKNCLLVDIEPQLAVITVDRTLGGEGEAFGQSIFPLDDLSRGVLAYTIARLLHSVGSDFLLRSIVTKSKGIRGLWGNGGTGLWPIQVKLGSYCGTVRIWFSPDSIRSDTPSELSIDSTILNAILRIQLTLVAIAGYALVSTRDIELLEPEDVVLLDKSSLYRKHSQWLGIADLILLGGRRTIWQCCIYHHHLRIESQICNKEPIMGKGETRVLHNPEELVQIAGDIPIEVTVELARFTLPLEELSSLRLGQILSTGQPLGDRVTLRTGGQAFACGELIDIDGDVGVRILSTGTQQSIHSPNSTGSE